MTTIIYNDNYQIIQQKHNIFSINFSIYSESIIQSITKTRLILGTTITNDFQTIIFNANSIKTLPEFKAYLFHINGKSHLPISLVAKLASDIGIQLSYLIQKYNITIIGFNPENIIVIDDSKFIYISSDYFTEINEHNNMCMVSFPIDFNSIFASPELFEIKDIPSFIYYKACYFSYGCLLLYTLLEDNKFYEIYVKESNSLLRYQKINEYLNNLSIKNSKLFCLIERCLVLEPENRSILFI
jgi:hypothetical protein